MFRYHFFQLRYDVRGWRRFTGLQNCVAVIWLMAYRESSDSIGDYTRMSERNVK